MLRYEQLSNFYERIIISKDLYSSGDKSLLFEFLESKI